MLILQKKDLRKVVKVLDFQYGTLRAIAWQSHRSDERNLPLRGTYRNEAISLFLCQPFTNRDLTFCFATHLPEEPIYTLIIFPPVAQTLRTP